jgi:hypothetical protein
MANHATIPFAQRPTTMFNADTVHTALGLIFTAVWLMVGQILIGSR